MLAWPLANTFSINITPQTSCWIHIIHQPIFPPSFPLINPSFSLINPSFPLINPFKCPVNPTPQDICDPLQGCYPKQTKWYLDQVIKSIYNIYLSHMPTCLLTRNPISLFCIYRVRGGLFKVTWTLLLVKLPFSHRIVIKESLGRSTLWVALLANIYTPHVNIL